MEYHVTWTIEVQASSSEEAARLARDIQLDPNSLATHFVVAGEDKAVRPIELDANGHAKRAPAPKSAVDAYDGPAAPPEDGETLYYEVYWIEGFEARSPQGAAAMARAFQRDPNKIANHFFIESEHGKRLEYWDPLEGSDTEAASPAEYQESEPREYRATWEIDVDAGSFREAAAEALRIQRDPHSIARVFTVTRADGASQRVDLLNPPERQPNYQQGGE